MEAASSVSSSPTSSARVSAGPVTKPMLRMNVSAAVDGLMYVSVEMVYIVMSGGR